VVALGAFDIALPELSGTELVIWALGRLQGVLDRRPSSSPDAGWGSDTGTVPSRAFVSQSCPLVSNGCLRRRPERARLLTKACHIPARSSFNSFAIPH